VVGDILSILRSEFDVLHGNGYKELYFYRMKPQVCVFINRLENFYYIMTISKVSHLWEYNFRNKTCAMTLFK